MCGIVGVIAPDASRRAFEGLKSLEYRGYDSWGVCVPAAKGGQFDLERHVGRIANALVSVGEGSEIALGHTRWATHGNVSERNCHPHLSNDGSVAIVHNGIVENFVQLKEKLSKKGFRFNSDTDSEVIANLIQHHIACGFVEAVRLSLLEIEGSYAIAALHGGEEKIVCARNGSPLVIGAAKGGEYYVASDATAFLQHTKNAVFLLDHQMAVCGKGLLEVRSVESGRRVRFRQKRLSWSIEQVRKGSFDHFMIKEISEQPSSIAAAVNQPRKELARFVSILSGARNIVLLGCGSSYHSCIAGSYFFSSVAGINARAILASEFPSFAKFYGKGSVVVAVSQSGETADLLEAVKAAGGENGAKVISIVNVMDSSLMRASDCTLLMNAGPEICVLSTKSYTSQLAILLLLAYSLAGDEWGGKQIIREAADAAKSILDSSRGAMQALAKKLADSNSLFVIGRSDAFPVSLEAALKIKEVSYIHAEGFAGAELKHGTIALVEQGTPAIVLSTQKTRSLTTSNAIEMKSRGAFIIGVDSQPNDAYDININVPELGSANPLMLIIPIQLLSYYLAIERGCDPDKPRNLAKAVTVK
ncbi:MAG TPA: glutamine--fructose-6-phosphate transaminase (isomerizing) [Candidatus Diapherotrites archaeon]|uniref:glutamine--fructose-6-phosphate transaminase (isomerizing) n=1 Tax=Candidatus Iainarchaeum sp. TaxID=3101447 RepID=A0A7J4J593_9ARCH|nr:glutamine--fructose-6-phosphate transaminase (isomerizing) [Candidatus Diapherotrites archaeon]